MTETPGQQLTAQQEIIISVLVSPAETAKLLHTTPGVLAVWRSSRRYALRFVRIGRKIMYRREDIQRFIEARTQSGVVDRPRGRSRRSAA
jgi:hypothetical protein